MATTTRIPRSWRPTRLGTFFCRYGRWTIEVHDGLISCRSANRSLEIPLIELARVETKAGVFWSSVVLVTTDDKFLVDGIPNAAAVDMSRGLRQTSGAAKISALVNSSGPLLSWARSIEEVLDFTHWITHEEIENLWANRPAQSEIGFDLDDLGRDLNNFPDLVAGIAETLHDALLLTPSH